MDLRAWIFNLLYPIIISWLFYRLTKIGGESGNRYIKKGKDDYLYVKKTINGFLCKKHSYFAVKDGSRKISDKKEYESIDAVERVHEY